MEQVILDEILSKHRKWINDEDGGERANLEYTDLRDTDLRNADLRYADLRNADLRYANLQKANLQKADLRNADLRNADLRYADLRNADLRYADLRYANLRNANLRNADLQEADLQNAELRYANLQNADIDYSCLPLWCGSLKMHICEKIAIQLLYHLLSCVSFSRHISPGIKKILLTKELVGLANKFHRVDECGEIEIFAEEVADETKK